MRLVAAAITRIEGDIVEEFVRHNLRYVDRMVVVDNASFDGTAEILASLEREGLPIDICRLEGADWLETSSPTMATDLVRRAFGLYGDAEYVLPLATDEFLKVESREAFEAELTRLDGRHAIAREVTYLPTLDDDPTETSVLRRIRKRALHEPSHTANAFPNASFGRDPHAFMTPGGHGIQSWTGTGVPLEGAFIAHFPVRSIAQICNKALLGWTEVVAQGFDETDGFGVHWKPFYDRLRSGHAWTDEDLLRIAWAYVGEGIEWPELIDDPLPPVERRYASGPMDPMKTAVEFSRQLALEVARLNRLYGRTFSSGNPAFDA